MTESPGSMTIAVVDMCSKDADAAFIRTLRNTGFAVLRNAPLSRTRLARMAGDWRKFFLSQEKWSYLATPTPSGNSSGYIPPEVSETAVGYAIKDLKEFFHVVPDTRLPDALAQDIHEHLAEAFALGQCLLGWLDQHCAAQLAPGVRGQLAASLSADDSLLRVLHYPPLTGDESPGAVRAAAHEDINLLTLLPVSAEPGLQVMTRDGSWADVPGVPGDVIVNSGDMLQEASSGRLPSTSHRVINPRSSEDNQSRISIPYFMAPRLDLKLSDQHTAGSYLHERLALLAR